MMRNGLKDFKGEWYVGQTVKVDLSEFDYVPKSRITTDGVGVIQTIRSKFLRTPDLTVILYVVRFNSGSVCGESLMRVTGEKLSKP
jgi:hypothetical protein